MRAVVCRSDGSDRHLVGEHLADKPDAWTQFAGWSPDGRTAIIGRGWQDPENAKWEEEHKSFRMEPGKWSLDSYLLEIDSGMLTNVCAVDRVSHYNSVTYSVDGKKLLMTSLVGGTSKPFLMDLDGHNKQDVSGGSNGFTYGFSASPQGNKISYHESYQVYIANSDGSEKMHIDTGNSFNFGPQWSADGEWVMFVSGEHYNCHPHVVRADGSGLKKIADRGGYTGVTEFLDVPDFHGGSSDLPVWSKTGNSIYFTAKVDENIELFHIAIDGEPIRLTHSSPGTTHYHPQSSPDGNWLIYGSKRKGIRQIVVRDLADQSETQITDLAVGHGAMWPHWQPCPGAQSLK
ncbi:MAG: hypothetical protein O2955_05905 [Planctomycetota bacterium]|nr:hypothetical protein [Planctomycetota bacterium]MDA1212028.1 hypothetical protein [Planctomycetota bacterium]